MPQQQSKKTVKINQGFKCQKCGFENLPALKTCRNHCQNCLYSWHVDQNLPGDRKSTCLSLMEPVRIDHDGKKGYTIVHQCLVCGKKISNKTADDDNIETIIKTMYKQNLGG
jgi:hypothetical protein